MERLPITLLSREVIAALEMLKYENNWGGGEIAVVGFGAEHLLKKKIQMCVLKMTITLIQKGSFLIDMIRLGT